MINLEEKFQSLLSEAAPEGSHLLASHLPDFPHHRLARDVQGAPIIMIAVPHGRTQTRPVPIKLEHLSIQHDVECRITGIDGVIEEGQFTIIACSGTDHALHSYFLRVLEPIITLLGPSPTRSDITRAIFNLVELFRVMAAAPTKSVQGLWAEVFLIARAADPTLLLAAWHTTPEDRYDFSSGDQRIEVKAAAGRVRRHQFSLEQLQPPTGTYTLVASVFVERAGAGTSLAELIEKVRHQVGDSLDLLMALDRIVGMTLGNSWRQAMGERFDYELALHSVAFFEVEAIPSVSPQLPPEVSGVRFTSDISGITMADSNYHTGMGDLFRAALLSG